MRLLYEHSVVQSDAADSRSLAPTLRSRIAVERSIFALLLLAIFVVRVASLSYNTLFVDDAIYATLGHDIFRRDFSQGASKWVFGSYLFPVLAGAVDSIAGVVGLRVMAALLSLASAVFVYLATHRLFGNPSALWALLFFGLSGASISLGQQSVIDSLGVPFLAASVYFLVLASQAEPQRSGRAFLLAGITLSLSMLSKYISLLFVPGLLLLVIVLQLAQNRSLRAFISEMQWVYCAAPVILLFGGYVAIYYSDLIEVFQADYSQQLATRGQVLSAIVEELGIVVLLAALGLVFAMRALWQAAILTRWKRWLVPVGLGVLFAAFLALPAYHVLSTNIRSISKHNVYTLVFLAPLAGYGVTYLANWLARDMFSGARLAVVRLGGAAITVTAALVFVALSQQQVNAFHRSWPNAASTIEYLKTLNVGPRNTVLASAAAIYEYYLDLGPASRQVWNNTWYIEYQGLQGDDAIRTTVGVCLYDVVVTDDYYNPEVNWYLEPLLNETGYALAYSTTEWLDTGSRVGIRVYLPSNKGECATRFAPQQAGSQSS